MQEISFEEFEKCEIRTGTILDAKPNAKARVPAYVLKIDFGEMGIKTSSAQITDQYQPENLVGMQVAAVMNFPAKRIAGIKSEVLILGAYSGDAGVVLLSPTASVANGSRVA